MSIVCAQYYPIIAHIYIYIYIYIYPLSIQFLHQTADSFGFRITLFDKYCWTGIFSEPNILPVIFGHIRGLTVVCWITDHYHPCSNLWVGISEGCYIFHFASLPLVAGRSIQPTICTKVIIIFVSYPTDHAKDGKTNSSKCLPQRLM